MPTTRGHAGENRKLTLPVGRVAVAVPPAFLSQRDVALQGSLKRRINISDSSTDGTHKNNEETVPRVSFLPEQHSRDRPKVSSPASSGGSMNASISQGISALQEKMDDARAHLMKVSIVDSAQRCQELAELMTSCAKGIRALQEISE